MSYIIPYISYMYHNMFICLVKATVLLVFKGKSLKVASKLQSLIRSAHLTFSYLNPENFPRFDPLTSLFQTTPEICQKLTNERR